MLYKSTAIDQAAQKIENMFMTQWRVYTIWQFDHECYGGVMKDVDSLEYVPFSFCDGIFFVDFLNFSDSFLQAVQSAAIIGMWTEFLDKN